MRPGPDRTGQDGGERADSPLWYSKSVPAESRQHVSQWNQLSVAKWTMDRVSDCFPWCLRPVSIATWSLSVWLSARSNCCGYVRKCCFGLSVLCCTLNGPHTPDSVMTSLPMTSARPRRPTLSDWLRARAVRSAHGTPGLYIPRCDPWASLLPLKLPLFSISLFSFTFFHLIIVSIVVASPQTSDYACLLTYNNILIFFFIQRMLCVQILSVGSPRSQNSRFTHLLLVVCSYSSAFMCPHFHLWEFFLLSFLILLFNFLLFPLKLLLILTTVLVSYATFLF